MGNPLHKLFKKLFTGPQKKEAETVSNVQPELEQEEGIIEESILEQEENTAEEEIALEQEENTAEEEIVLEQEENTTEEIALEQEKNTTEEIALEQEKNTVEEIALELEQEENTEEVVGVEEKQPLRIKDYIEDETEELETNEVVIEREIRDYITTKAYEEKLINDIEEQGIIRTTQINGQVVAYMLDYPGMTIVRAKSFLSKFKGYITFKSVARLFTREEWEALENTLDWRIHIKMQPVYSEVKIKDVFKESSYEPLHKLAKIKEISKLGEITTAFLVSYKNYTGVGTKKYQKTLEILARYAMKDSSFACIGIAQEAAEAIADYEICLESHLYEVFNKSTLGQIGIIYGIAIDNGLKKVKLKQLQHKSINTASGLINRPALENALKSINQIVVPSLAFEQYEDREGLEVLKYRFEEGYSLEETANKLGQTLEVTSKLQMQTLEALTEILRSSKLVEILTYLNKGDHHVAFKVVETVLGEKNRQIISLIKYNAFHDLGYNPILNMVFLHEEVGEEQLMETLADKLPEAFELTTYEKTIEQAIGAIGIKKWGKDVIPNLLEAMGYKANGRFYSKESISSSYILDMIFRDKFKKPVYLDEDMVELLVEEAKKEYNYVLGNNKLTIEQKIKEAQEVVQVGSNTYVHSSRLKCKKEIIDELENHLMEVAKTASKVNAYDLYNKMKDQLKGSSIQDQYGLYHVIFYYFGQRYKKEGEGSLNIILREEKREKNQIVGLEQVAPRLQQLINKYMDNGYIKTQEFLQEILKREELQEFLQVNQLDDYKVIASVLKQVDDTLLGGDEFLYRVNSLYQSLEELEAAQV